MLQRNMEISPTYSPNTRILFTKTKSPMMFWRRDLVKVDQIVQSSDSLSCASSRIFIQFPPYSIGSSKKNFNQSGGNYCVGREVTGFLDLMPEFWLLDVPECEKLTFHLPLESTFEDLESRDREILAEFSSDLTDRLKFRHISMEGEQKGSTLSDLRMELQYFFGWT